MTTPDDFGLRSDPPSHPELLDYLAWRFVQDGWSLKKLHRVLMLSSVYQQKSDDDLIMRSWIRTTAYWRKRTAGGSTSNRCGYASVVAGNLDHSFGGRPVDLLKRGTLNQQPFSNRRTVYGSIDRNDLLALFQYFDFANPDITTAPA